MIDNLKLQEAIEIVKRIDIFEFNNPLKIVISAAQSIMAGESDGQALYHDLCGRLIGRILAFNPDEHDIELNLCGTIAKAQLPKPSGEAKQMTVDQLMTFMKEHIRIDMSIAIGGMGTSQVLNDEGYRRIAAALFEAVYGGKDDH